MLCGIKLKAINVKDNSEYVFDSLGEAVNFLEQKLKKEKTHFARSIKACFNGYQETAYGYKFIKIED